MSIDIEMLRKAVDKYAWSNVTSSADGSVPCTANDLKALRDKTAALFNLFLRELERA